MAAVRSLDRETCRSPLIHAPRVAAARAALADDGVYAELATLFGALADPTRARIVHSLMHRELCTCDIAATMGITDSGASQHLRVLRSLRLVKSRRAGKFVYYSLDDAHVALLVQVGLAHLGHEQDAPGITQGIMATTAEGLQ